MKQLRQCACAGQVLALPCPSPTIHLAALPHGLKAGPFKSHNTLFFAAPTTETDREEALRPKTADAAASVRLRRDRKLEEARRLSEEPDPGWYIISPVDSG